MAFPTDWGRKCELVIQHGQVSATLSNFPALVTKDTLPSEIFDADGSYPALNGGGDIRFSSNSDGSTQLACEIEQFITDNNPANGKAAIWVNVPSVASAANTSIWIWYNKAGESQPAEGAAYGKHAVWDSKYKLIQHQNQDPSGSAPQMIDSTSNSNDGTSHGSMVSADLVDGKIGKGLDFDGVDDCIAIGSSGLTNYTGTLSAWIYPHTEGEGNQGRISIISSAGWDVIMFDFAGTNRLAVGMSDGTNSIGRTGTDNDVTLNAWNHVAYSYTGGAGGTNIHIYVDGSEVNYTSSDGTASISPTPTAIICGANASAGEYAFDGLIEEMHFSTTVLSAAWITTEYNNQNSPATFIIEGTPETPGGGPAANAPTGIFYGPLYGPFFGPIG